MRPSDLLTGLPPQFETRTEGEKWKGAFEASRGAIREQGQVMSAALTNNRSLWETNKALRREREELISRCAQLESERNRLSEKLACIPPGLKDRAALQAENDALKHANAFLKNALTASLMPELDSDQRRSEIERLAKQRAELDSTGLEPSAQELADRDAKLAGWEGGAPRAGESMQDVQKRVALEKAYKLEAAQSVWDARLRERALALQRAGLVGDAYLAGFEDLGPRPA